MVCADKGDLVIPFPKPLCRAYLFTFRGTERDIAALHQGIGASFVTQGASSIEEREQIMRFLIDKGLRIDHPDMHQGTPLHAAVIANAANEVGLLLRAGARTDIRDRRFGLTPLELARKLEQEGAAGADRQAVISLLQQEPK